MRLYYEEQGWKYICKTGYFHLYQATREDATEIHTDAVIQGETFANLNKRLKYMSWYITILYSFTACVILYTMLRIHPIYFSIRNVYNISDIPMILLFLFTIWQAFCDYRKVKKLKEQLESGIEMNHYDSYKPSFRQYFLLAAPIIILVFMFSSGHYNKKTYWEESLSTYAGKLPTISITALETDSNFSIEYGENFVGGNISYISHHWSELSPEAYHIEEQGRTEGQMWDDNSGTYSPSMETEYYRMRFQFLAKVLFQELLDNKINRDYYEVIQYHTLFDTKFDEAALVMVDSTQILFARTGEEVIFVQYHGSGNLESVVEQIYDAVVNFHTK